MKKIIATYKPWQAVDYVSHRRGKDNDGYYNSSGNPCNNHNSMRIPSLKANNKVWKKFYKLFPNVKKFLCGEEGAWYGSFGEVKLVGDVYHVRKECHCGLFRIRLYKFKKVW